MKVGNKTRMLLEALLGLAMVLATLVGGIVFGVSP